MAQLEICETSITNATIRYSRFLYRINSVLQIKKPFRHDRKGFS